MLHENASGVGGLLLCAPYLGTPSWEADQRKNISQMPFDVRDAIEKAERSDDYGSAYQDTMTAYYKRHLCLLDPWPDCVRTAFDQLNLDVYRRLWGPSEFTARGLLRNYDLFPRLGEVTIPVLLTCGDRDEARVETVRSFQLAFSNASMAVLPDASHLHQIEQPRIFLSVVRSFLSALERPATRSRRER